MKIWTMAWNETVLRFRDRNALLLMLVAPLVLSFIIGSSFAGFLGGGDGSPLRAIPLLIVNEDRGEVSAQILNIIRQDEMIGVLLAPTVVDDVAAARETVARGQARAVLVLPAGLSEQFDASMSGHAPGTSATLRLYTDPAAIITPAIIEGVVTQIAAGYNGAMLSAEVSREMGQRHPPASPPPANMADLLREDIESRFAARSGPAVAGRMVSAAAQEGGGFDPLAYFAPSMAIFFLMFTLFEGTRSLLEDEQNGNLARLMSTPTPLSSILLGKIGGTFLTGLLQFVIFVVVTRFAFGLSWGRSPLALVILALAVVAAATSLGAFVAAVTRDLRQAAIVGSTIVLLSGLVGGAFFTPYDFPGWLALLSRLSVNRWAIDGLVKLTMRDGSLPDVLPEVTVLFVLGATLFTISLLRFRRRFAR